MEHIIAMNNHMQRALLHYRKEKRETEREKLFKN